MLKTAVLLDFYLSRWWNKVVNPLLSGANVLHLYSIWSNVMTSIVSSFELHLFLLSAPSVVFC